MAFLGFGRRRRQRELAEAAPERAIPANAVRRRGYEAGIPAGGIDEVSAGVGASTNTDRRSALTELFEAYIACPWAWACVNAIARSVTAGGLVTDWVTDTGEGDQEQPDKPPAVLALERLIEFTNPRQNIRQLLRAFIVDLLIFGDAFLEVVWWGNQPVALYSLDAATTTPLADEHGDVRGYVQVSDSGQRAEFEPREVIHVSLDAPRSGVFGIPPMQAALLPVTAWLHAAATGKEMMRKGLPPEIHADFPASTSDGETRRWRDRYMISNVGPRNIGAPRITKGGAKLTELQSGKTADVLASKDQSRDEILAAFGVPPAKAGVIESGNLGGGTGESQQRTFEIDTCAPVAELVLEAFNFAVVRNGFGIDEWKVKFREVDYRSSETVEQIRDTRLRNGSWVLNKYRAEIGEPPVEGGDDAVLVDRQNLVLWADMARMSQAVIASKGAPAVAAGETPPGGEQFAGKQQPPPADEDEEQQGVPAETWHRYRARLREMMSATPLAEAAPDATADAVRTQLSAGFPPGALKWISTVSWDGPQMVPLGDIDTSDRAQWSASREEDRVARARKKLRKRLMAGDHPKPVILVKTPGSAKWVIADGHHRFLAAQAEKQDGIWAFRGKTKTEHGAWEILATSQVKGDGSKAA